MNEMSRTIVSKTGTDPACFRSSKKGGVDITPFVV